MRDTLWVCECGWIPISCVGTVSVKVCDIALHTVIWLLFCVRNSCFVYVCISIGMLLHSNHVPTYHLMFSPPPCVPTPHIMFSHPTSCFHILHYVPTSHPMFPHPTQCSHTPPMVPLLTHVPTPHFIIPFPTQYCPHTTAYIPTPHLMFPHPTHGPTPHPCFHTPPMVPLLTRVSTPHLILSLPIQCCSHFPPNVVPTPHLLFPHHTL